MPDLRLSQRAGNASSERMWVSMSRLRDPFRMLNYTCNTGRFLAMQNVEPLTTEKAREMLEMFEKAFPHVAEYHKQVRSRLFRVDVAKIEKRILAQWEKESEDSFQDRIGLAVRNQFRFQDLGEARAAALRGSVSSSDARGDVQPDKRD